MALLIAFSIPSAILLLSSYTHALDCPTLNKELGRLRLSYHKQAQGALSPNGAISFDDLAAILDKIVELKNSMRRLDCDIPPRHKSMHTGR